MCHFSWASSRINPIWSLKKCRATPKAPNDAKVQSKQIILPIHVNIHSCISSPIWVPIVGALLKVKRPTITVAFSRGFLKTIVEKLGNTTVVYRHTSDNFRKVFTKKLFVFSHFVLKTNKFFFAINPFALTGKVSKLPALKSSEESVFLRPKHFGKKSALEKFCVAPPPPPWTPKFFEQIPNNNLLSTQCSR